MEDIIGGIYKYNSGYRLVFDVGVDDFDENHSVFVTSVGGNTIEEVIKRATLFDSSDMMIASEHFSDEWEFVQKAPQDLVDSLPAKYAGMMEQRLNSMNDKGYGRSK